MLLLLWNTVQFFTMEYLLGAVHADVVTCAAAILLLPLLHLLRDF